MGNIFLIFDDILNFFNELLHEECDCLGALLHQWYVRGEFLLSTNFYSMANIYLTNIAIFAYKGVELCGHFSLLKFLLNKTNFLDFFLS